MEKKSWKETLSGKMLIWTLVIGVLAVVFHWITAGDWDQSSVITETVTASGTLPWSGEEDNRIVQTFTQTMDDLQAIRLAPGNFVSGTEDGPVTFRLLEGDRVLWEDTVPSGEILAGVQYELRPAVAGKKGSRLTLEVLTGRTGTVFQFGSSVSAGKYELEAARDGELTVNGQEIAGILWMELDGRDYPGMGWLTWVLAGAVWLGGVLFMLAAYRSRKAGRLNAAGMLEEIWRRYSYLLKKLVARDFRVKYQASVLGFLWSFLNPLLTMFVYLFVFNMLFRSNVQNFPVYLLTGIVLFNFFSESTSQGLQSITGNRHLITKVYMPKYIYPLAKVLSSAVNLVISFIPLMAVILVTGMPLHKSFLLFPLVILFLAAFSTGMSMIVATMNVFFRDTEFLWGILIMVWNFLTPVFYPESIIPAAYRTIYHLNPMYQIIYFMRSITIGGVSPTPVTYLYCCLAAFIPLGLGALVMKKKQDQFVLHL